MAWSLTSSGVVAPATISASGNANTLDDYQEGTWTPATNGGWATNPSGVNCDYVLLGLSCNYTGYWVTQGGASGSVAVNTNGLPFNVAGPASITVCTANITGGTSKFYAQRLDGTNNEIRWYTKGGTNCGWYVTGFYTATVT